MKPRNNISKLPVAIRTKICDMLLDGATYDDIRQDEDVAAACCDRHLTIHNATFGFYRESQEYAEYVRTKRKWGDDIERRRIAAQVVSESGTADDVARVATYELMRRVLYMVESGEDIDLGTLRTVSAALANYERSRQAAEKIELEKKEAIRQQKINELEAKIAELTAEKKDENACHDLTQEQIQKIKEGIGL